MQPQLSNVICSALTSHPLFKVAFGLPNDGQYKSLPDISAALGIDEELGIACTMSQLSSFCPILCSPKVRNSPGEG